MPKLSRAEQETIIRWDEDDQRVNIYTASLRVKARLEKRGYVFTADRPFGWRTVAAPRSATFRRVNSDGSIVKAAARSRPGGFQRKTGSSTL